MIDIKIKPKQEGHYLVKFYNPYMHETDRIEIVQREFKDDEWVNPIYNFKGDGYKLVGWYDNSIKE